MLLVVTRRRAMPRKGVDHYAGLAFAARDHIEHDLGVEPAKLAGGLHEAVAVGRDLVHEVGKGGLCLGL
jgi:hypothetical protein